MADCTGSSTTVNPPLSSSPQPDDDLWFKDGNVILVAGDTKFRFYKGLLTTHSPVFEEMLSLPHPESDSAAVDGSCPVIRLDVSPVNLKCFLQHIPLGRTLTRYQNDHLFECSHHALTHAPYSLREPSFDEIHACILLARKYDFRQIFKQYLEYLQKFYPSQLESLDPDLLPSNPPGFLPIHCIGIVNLARSIGEDSLLPVALARCMPIHHSELSVGFLRADGVREVLSSEDIVRVLVAQKDLTQTYRRIEHELFTPGRFSVCDSCKSILRSLYGTWVAASESRAALDPLRLLHVYVELLDKQRHNSRAHCKDCYYRMVQTAKRAQKEILIGLPTTMGVVKVRD
ncbi:hypothetical protein GY45DRAFT_1243182 [Cubamyces sp. BRFM 1775]|nr:hypothetical protein GY45DRAFT_1243182 [Cubamyces sp. BRFM 1775]